MSRKQQEMGTVFYEINYHVPDGVSLEEFYHNAAQLRQIGLPGGKRVIKNEVYRAVTEKGLRNFILKVPRACVYQFYASEYDKNGELLETKNLEAWAQDLLLSV